MYKFDMLWRRTAAFIIDYNICLYIVILFMGLAALLDLALKDVIDVYFSLALIFSAPLIALLYFPLFYSSTHQATLGMQCAKIHISDMHEMHLGFLHSLWRGFIGLVIAVIQGYFILYPLTKWLFSGTIKQFVALAAVSKLSPQYQALYHTLAYSPGYLLGMFIFIPVVLSVQLIAVLLTPEAQALSDIFGRTLVFSLGEEKWTTNLPPAMKKMVIEEPRNDRSLTYHSPLENKASYNDKDQF